MSTKRPLALLCHTLDSLCIDWEHVQTWEPWYLVEEDSAEETWAQSFLPRERILSYSCTKDSTPEELLTTSTIPEVLLSVKIDALFFTDSMTLDLQNWSQDHGIEMVVTPFAIQEKFENKIWFDGFLQRNALPKPNGFVGTLPADAHKLSFPCVIQDAHSRGGEGTYIVDSPEAFENLFEQDMFRPNTPYLIREFVQGTPLGITALITSEHIALSAPCMQCFFPGASPRRFAGVQFLPTTTMSTQLRKTLEEVFLSLAKKFHAEGYRGYANLDFILTPRETVSIIECNPRFTAASAHHNLFSGLFGGLPSGAYVLEEFAHEPTDSKPTIHPFPQSSFEGAVLFGYADMRKGDSPLSSGAYRLRGSQLQKLSPSPLEIHEDSAVFIYAEATHHASDDLLITDTCISSVPLYGSDGSLNEQGKAVLAHL